MLYMAASVRGLRQGARQGTEAESAAPSERGGDARLGQIMTGSTV